ncbi:MAG TPA: endo-1,4-beta-xylanase [Bacteroidaceae bacterium]|nr:endo-1,4-beta-xylanase [Bacteroidaceae bacterium]
MTVLKKIITVVCFTLITVAISAKEKYEMGKPNDPVNYGYLNDFHPLKEYIDTDKYPNFQLGIGTTVDNYLSNNVVKGMTNNNFTETVAGNAMKMSSCVNSKGEMNFSKVTNYVNAATNAGLKIYGHTLAWHSQQPGTWLHSLIKDLPAPEIEGADIPFYTLVSEKDFRTNQSVGWSSDKTTYGYSLTYTNTDGLKIHTTKLQGSWEVQFIAVGNIMIEPGKSYRMTMTVKGSSAGNLHSKLGDWSVGAHAEIPFTTQWKDVVIEYKAVGGDFLLLQCGDFVGDIHIRRIVFEEKKMAINKTEERRCLVVNATAKESQVWDNQFWLVSNIDFNKGDTYEFTATIRADKAAYASTQIHDTPGSYVSSDAFGRINFTTDWKSIKISGSMSNGGKSIAFNLNEYADANNYYFENLSLKINKRECLFNGNLKEDLTNSFRVKINNQSIVKATIEDSISYVYLPSSIPLPAEVVRDTLKWAMEKWIKGMMHACNGKVKAWDVVNEAISGGGNDGEGNYLLQHDDGSGNFFWQDYMGDLEYVRSAVRYARQYGPSDIKLYVNDYNLESDWDNNKKVKSLINWIKKWEADGVTKIDGIGSQMHISCYMNKTTQDSKKAAITNSFKLMAASGKLVRISEFDMGMVDENGNNVSTNNMTEDMHQRMADLYEWIIKQYLTIIPPSQQAGICFWCPTDSPSGSGWRADTPVGIWTIDYYRKHAYAGIVRGLGGVLSSVEDIKSDSKNYGSSRIYNINGTLMPDYLNEESLPKGMYIIDGRKVLK